MLHVMSARCVACDLHTIGHLSVCVVDGSQRSEEIVKNLELRPFSVVIIIIFIIHQSTKSQHHIIFRPNQLRTLRASHCSRSFFIYTFWCMYICIDLYMCMNTNVHVCPYISAYDVVVCTL